MAERIKLMTDEEAAYYVTQIARRGKANALPPEQLAKYKKAYDGITAHLKENFRPYLVYYVSSGKNRLSEPILAETIKKAKAIDLFQNLNNALSAGDADTFNWYCWLLKLLYRVEEHEQKKRDNTV